MAAKFPGGVLLAGLFGIACCLSLQAHERGHARLSVAQRYQHAVELGRSGQLQAAREMLNSLASLGDRAAQFELYKMAIRQPGADSAEIAVLLRLAAGPASGPAQLKLAESYLDGVGRPANPNRAVFWFKQAARQGQVVAQVLLAGMLKRGDGIAADPAEATFWMERAADGGSSEAAFRLGKAKPGAGGRPMIEQAARAGHSGAQRYLGLQLARGGAYAIDEPLSLHWLTRAAESGDSTAMLLVGHYYLQGRGTEIDTDLAYRWLKRAQINGEKAAIPQVMALESSMQLGPKVAAMTAAMADVLPDPLPLSVTEIDFPANQLLGYGAAFWINQTGYLLTNHHVVERCNELRITGIGVARVVASEPQNDIAILKVAQQSDHWAVFDQRLEPQLGAAVSAFILQHPDSEFEQTLAHPGTVRALARPDLDGRYFRFDARLEPGSSGAPVIDQLGHVVGMVVAKLGPTAAYEVTGTSAESVSFALQPALIRAFLDIYAIEHTVLGNRDMDPGQIVEHLECWY